MNKNKIVTFLISTFLLSFIVLFLSPVNAYAFRFVSWADTKSATSALGQLSNQVKALNPKPVFTIYPGDLESDGVTSAGMAKWKDAVNGYNGNGIFDITFPTRGNHDNRNGAAPWSAYFNLKAQSQTISGISNFRELAPDLTYSFDYENSHFVGIDGPGSVSTIQSAQSTWLDQDLKDAAGRGLTHAFLFFHGPIYYIANHSSTPPSHLINVINSNPIVSATFNGHEHAYAWVHINKSRVPSVTREFEQFVTGSAGAGPTTCSSGRCDYDLRSNGIATVDVNGNDYTVSFYKIGSSSPTWSRTFSKGGNPPPTFTPGPTRTPTPTKKPSTTPTQGPSPTTTGILGDADGDGKVNIKDYIIWVQNFNLSGSGPRYGDFNSSGFIDGVDYLLWMKNYSGPTGTPTHTVTYSPSPTGQAGYIDHAKCNPDLGSNAFTNHIDNKYLPFSTGMNNDHFIYNSSTGEKVRFRILSFTKDIPGADVRDPVKALVLEEYETVNNNWIETSQNWFAQTMDGTVCYMGENTFTPGNPNGGAHGSWEAGKNNAKAGIMMPPNPTVGQSWIIEDAAADGAYEDGKVQATGVTFNTPAGTFNNTIYIVEDFGASKKRYAIGIGMIFDDGMSLTSY